MMTKVVIPEGTYKFVIVRCQTVGCACKTAIDNVAVGPKGGLVVRRWSCSKCGAEYAKSGNEILTIFASELGVFEKHRARIADSHQPSIDKTPATHEPSQSFQTTNESESDSTKLAICIALLVFALIYVPVEACNSSYCVSFGWKWLWSLDRLQVAGLRLFIQVVIALIAATIIWRVNIQSLPQGLYSPTMGSKFSPKNEPADPNCPSSLNVWTKFILGLIVASLLFKPVSNFVEHPILQSALIVLPLIPWFLAISKRQKFQKNN